MGITSQVIEQWFKNIKVPDQCREDCIQMIITPDINGTGDSPTGYECDCPKARECPVVIEQIEEYLDCG